MSLFNIVDIYVMILNIRQTLCLDNLRINIKHEDQKKIIRILAQKCVVLYYLVLKETLLVHTNPCFFNVNFINYIPVFLSFFKDGLSVTNTIDGTPILIIKPDCNMSIFAQDIFSSSIFCKNTHKQNKINKFLQLKTNTLNHIQETINTRRVSPYYFNISHDSFEKIDDLIFMETLSKINLTPYKKHRMA